jgi:hypothetical protein
MNVVQQGWQCPLCKTVYAPHMTSCRCQGTTFPTGPWTPSFPTEPWYISGPDIANDGMPLPMGADGIADSGPKSWLAQTVDEIHKTIPDSAWEAEPKKICNGSCGGGCSC